MTSRHPLHTLQAKLHVDPAGCIQPTQARKLQVHWRVLAPWAVLLRTLCRSDFHQSVEGRWEEGDLLVRKAS